MRTRHLLSSIFAVYASSLATSLSADDETLFKNTINVNVPHISTD